MSVQPLQYASLATPTERRQRPVWTLVKLSLLLVVEICIAIFLTPADSGLWSLGFFVGVAIVVTLPIVIGALLRCIVPPSVPKLSEPERRTLVGECARCGYDLRGANSHRCPECGWLVPRPDSRLCWPDPDGPRETSEIDQTAAVEAYLREVMRGRPTCISPAWGDDPHRSLLAVELAEICRDANGLDSANFLPEDSFAVATVSPWAHFAVLQALDRYLEDPFRRDVAARLRGMTFGEVVDWALKASAANG